MRKLLLTLLLGLFLISFASAITWNATDYYKLDESSGAVIDLVGNYNLINSGATPGVTGILNTAYDFESTENDYLNASSGLNFTDKPFSYNIWVKPESLTNDAGQIDALVGATATNGYYFGIKLNGNLSFGKEGVDSVTTTGRYIGVGSWQMITMVYNSSGINFFVNGSHKETLTYSSTFNGAVKYTVGKLSTNYFDGLMDEVSVWNRALNTTEVLELYNDGYAKPYNDSVVNSPANNTLYLTNEDILFNFTVSKINTAYDLKNISLYLNGTLNETKTISGSLDTETFTKQFSTTGNRTFYATYCDTNNNCVNTSINNVEINFFKVNALGYNTTSYETAQETFSVNVSGTITSASLYYNGTAYSATNSGDNWTTTLQVPASTGNKTLYWRFNNLGNSQNFYQNVLETNFILCNATYATKFLNISFKDESDSSSINASIPTSTFIYYLGDGTVNKTYTYINSSVNYYYAFCAVPNRTLYVDSYVQYKQGSDYPQRVYDTSPTAYTNSTTNTTLYLLGVANGIYVTFQTINSAEQIISGVLVTAQRTIDSILTTVGVGTTGDSGSVTFWLNPDFVHDFTFSKSGFTTVTSTFAPTQTSYTITMGGGTTVENSTIRGIKYSTLPVNSFLENDTEYTFGFNLTSSYWDLDEYGFNLRLANGTIITGDSTSTSGTQLTRAYNVNNQSVIYLDAYWKINGNYTNITKIFMVQNTEYSGYSIKTFFTDLNSYLDTDMFGLDNFGRNLIAFLIIFISVGMVSYKFGISSPLGLSTLAFGIVLFLDVITGILPDINGISNLPTYIFALILILAILNEVQTR